MTGLQTYGTIDPMHTPALPVSVIVTVFNEIATLESLLQALARQTRSPKAVIIVDGGSNDGTWERLNTFTKHDWPFTLTIEQQPGNRSVGRNRAIEWSAHSWLACTDAGCVPDKHWLEELWQARQAAPAWVVAGYYRGMPQSSFEEAVVPYALVMPDQVDPAAFLPATRSLLMHKAVWSILGGFDETLSDNEDYAFARKIPALTNDLLFTHAQQARLTQVPAKKAEVLTFAPKAIVGWRPRSNLLSFSWMIYRFARGDARARLWRPKVALIYLRYILFFLYLALIPLVNAPLFTLVWFASIVAYITWSIAKNYSYAPKSWYWLPVLQITSDVAVMWGTMRGLRNTMEC